MKVEQSYKKSLQFAILLHIFLALILLIDFSFPHSQLPQAGKSNSIEQNQAAVKPEIVKAVSVDQKIVEQTIKNLQEERNAKVKAEQARQVALQKQAQLVKQQRLLEQKRIARLQEEAIKLAQEQKKKLAEEQQHIKELAQQKAAEAKKIAELQKQQKDLEIKNLEQAKQVAAEKKAQAQENALKAKQQAQIQAQKKQEALQNQAKIEAAKKAAIASEVDRFKALIVNAIGRQWILPEHVDEGLASQFRIRLAPDGAVLEVALIKSSGNPILDRSAQTAIYKASPLPVPTDPDTFDVFRDISLTVRPENVRG